MINRSLFLEIIDELTPHFVELERRYVIVYEAVFGSNMSHNTIKYDGSAREFTSRLVKEMLTFGNLESDKYAIVSLLEAVTRYVGLDRRRNIERLIKHCNESLSASEIEGTTSQEPVYRGTAPLKKNLVPDNIVQLNLGDLSSTSEFVPKTVQFAQCRICGVTNTSRSKFCVNCGAPLRRSKSSSKPTQPLPSVEDMQSKSVFQYQTALLILKPEHHLGNQIKIDFSEDISEIIVGRRDDNFFPDVDLTRYDANEKGVSRFHLLIRCQKVSKSGLIYVSDLESSNRTRLNGKLLVPRKEKRLSKGDHLQLGHLGLEVSFINKTLNKIP